MNKYCACATCAFWDRIQDNLNGFCRRKSPVWDGRVATTADNYDYEKKYCHYSGTSAIWPVTSEDDYCGEWCEDMAPPEGGEK